MSVNKVLLVGNLGKDPEIKELSGGKKVSNFSLATTESYKDKDGNWVNNTEWHNVTFFGPVAAFIEKLKKGNQVYVEGKIKTESYDDKDGVKRYSTKIYGDTIRALDKKERSEGSGTNSTPASTPAPQASAAESDDLPF